MNAQRTSTSQLACFFSVLLFILATISCCFVPVIAAADSTTTIVVASFQNASCATIKTHPQTLTSGQCVFSGDFQFYYTIVAESDNTARYLYGCAQGCNESSCALKGSTTFGSCAQVPISNSSFIYVSAWRIIPHKTLDIRVFTDLNCDNQVTDYGTIALSSGRCTQVNAIQQNLMVSYVDPRDVSSSSEALSYRAGCNNDCSSCAAYGRAALDLCTPVEDVYVTVTIAGNSTSTDITIHKWELAVIVICSVAGGALASCVCCGFLFALYVAIRGRHHGSYSAINH